MENIEKVQRPRFGERESGPDIKETLADKLKSAAESIRSKSQQSGAGGATEYRRTAANLLDKSSDYVRNFDAQKLKADIEDKVRRNPGRTLLVAGAIGLALGALVRRR